MMYVREYRMRMGTRYAICDARTGVEIDDKNYDDYNEAVAALRELEHEDNGRLAEGVSGDRI